MAARGDDGEPSDVESDGARKKVVQGLEAGLLDLCEGLQHIVLQLRL